MVENKSPLHRRELLSRIVVYSVWAVLTLRLLHIQVFSRETFATQATRQQVSREVLPARPGDLIDRKGRLLATTIRTRSLFVDPAMIEDKAMIARQIAPVIGLNANELQQKIEEHSQHRFLWVKRHLEQSEAERIEELKLQTNSWGFRYEFKRHYPQEGLAAHVIGLRDIDGVGRGGSEQAFDELLRGRDGLRRYVRDARGTVLEVLEEVTTAPQNGETVALTLDVIMQLRTEQVLDDLVEDHGPEGACAIVLDPKNGEVLAMASRPTFNPSDPADVEGQAWKNLAISAVFEPGSTIKPLVVAWGLDHEILKSDEKFHCEWGKYRMGRRLLHDHHPYGELKLTDVLVKSSNIGMAKIGERLGNEQLFSLAASFGFGKRTGIELAGEVPGFMLPLSEWTDYSTGSIPMGHEIAVTPLQMISAHAILANGGQRISPHLLLTTSNSQVRPKQVVISRVVSSDVAAWVIQNPMREVVERGTGTKAKLKDVEVFGKTGTAQKVKPTGGYYANKNVVSFVCGAPAADPQLLVIVCVDEPHGPSQFGGSVAAPYAAEILDYCLKIQESSRDAL